MVGRYALARLPGYEGACVQVTFPLPNGHAMILLRPQHVPNGGLLLRCDGVRHGEPGFYFTVLEDEARGFVRFVATMKEELTLMPADDGLEGCHRFAVFGRPFLELRYRITPKRGVSGA